jgi:hypothetical protein
MAGGASQRPGDAVVYYDLTDTEYLLWVSPEDGHRAERIAGAGWDKARNCWVYPRTADVRNALEAEFAGETRRRPPAPQKNGSTPPQRNGTAAAPQPARFSFPTQ